MSLEKNIERIAESLERLVRLKKDSIYYPAAVVEEQVSPGQQDLPKEIVPTPPVAAPTPPVPPTPPAPSLTMEQLNEELVKQHERLGYNMEPISTVIKKYGADSLAGIDPSKYAQILADVKAL